MNANPPSVGTSSIVNSALEHASFDAIIAACEHAFATHQEQLNQAATACGGRLTVFFSLCNGHERATVFHHSGPNWPVVWAQGKANLLQLNSVADNPKRKHPWMWLRIDWVSNIQAPVTFKQWQQQLANVKRNYYRNGIAFDEHFKVALTEQELNANACLYMGAQVAHAAFNEKNVQHYLTRRFGVQCQLALHNDALLWPFQTTGLFINGENAAAACPKVYSLDTTTGNQGRRILSPLNADFVGEVITTASQFLSTQVQPSGRFVYGHFPVFGQEISAYNTLRHASTVYAMLEAWEYTRDAALMLAIERAIEYLLTTCIRTYTLPDVGEVAFNVEIDSQEIKLGASAVAILALVKYDQLTGNVQHRSLLTQLALGIAAMQNPNTGRFVHVLHADTLNIKEAFRIVYYDGEAAFALMRLYGLTHDDRWLALVQNAFEYFIEAEHWKHHDHWLSYCVNELTLYKPDFKYFKFGVQNITGYLDFIEHRQTTFPTLLELCMAFEHMLVRIQTTPSLQPLLNGFDVAHFFRAMHRRANHLMNGYFFPEVAMYFKKPNTIVGSFFIRHHSFRVRIDDVEHYLSGLVAYRKFLLKQVAETDTNHATINKLPILAWGGDVNLARRMHRRVCDLPSESILNVPALKQADFALVNLECVVALSGQQGINKGEGGPYYFRARPDMLKVLQEANIKAVITANNHSGDYGPEALAEQAYWLEQSGIQFTGSGRNAAEAALPLYAQVGDVRVAIFGFDTTQKTFAATEHQAGTNFIDLAEFPKQTREPLGQHTAPMQELSTSMAKLCDAFQQAKAEADLVVVAIHWGPNRATQPTPEVRNAAHWLIELGADAILGSSSHVLQGIEIWQGCPIIFDAGDLLFDSRADAKGKPGAVFHLHLSKQGVKAIEVFRLRVGYGQTQQLAAVADEVVHIDASLRKKNVFAKSGLPLHAISNPRLPAEPPAIATMPQRWQIAEVPADANIQPINLGVLVLKGLRLSPRLLNTRTMIWVETFWEILEATDQDFLLDMRVVAINGDEQSVFGAGSDHQFCDWQLPTTQWEPHQIYRDHYGLRPPQRSDMKPGRYALSIRIVQGSKAIAGVSLLEPIVVEHQKEHRQYQVVRLEPRTSEGVWTPDELAKATGGQWVVPPSTATWVANGVVRARSHAHFVGSPCLYVASSRANLNFHEMSQSTGGAAKEWDSHNQLHNVQKTFCGAIVQHVPKGLRPDFPVLKVDDPIRALMQLGAAARARMKGLVVAVTGSSGKSSVVEMTHHVASSFLNSMASYDNYNSRVGMLICMASMPANTDLVALEVAVSAINAPGFIPIKMVCPDIAIITNISASHLKPGQTLNDVARRKANIMEGVRDGGMVILNQDDAFFEYFVERAQKAGLRWVSVGQHAASDVRLLNYNANDFGFSVSVFEQTFDLALSIPGEHMALNACFALAVFHIQGLLRNSSGRDLRAPFKTFHAPEGRGNQHSITLGSRNITLVNDAYNANPASMKAALSTFAQMQVSANQKVLVLGDMLELGDLTADAHIALVEPLSTLPTREVLLIGNSMKLVHQQLVQRGNHPQWFENLAALTDYLLANLQNGDCVTLKASNSIGLFKVIEALMKQSVNAS